MAIDSNNIGLIALALGMIASTAIGSNNWRSVKEKPFARSLEVTGSAKKRITSDLIEWSAVVEARATDRTECYRILHADANKTIEFLQAKGIKKQDIFPQSVTFGQMYETETRFVDKERVEKQIATGWVVSQAITVRSLDVPLVEISSREVTSLLEKGISVRSSSPSYYYTKLGELKIEMLAAAAKDARVRAENIVKSTGGATIGDLISADMGVININPANSSTTSWEGNNDTSSLEKDILTIVHTKFSLN